MMITNRGFTKLLMMAVLVSIAFGCAKKKDSGEPPAAPPVTDDRGGSVPDPGTVVQNTNIVDFKPVSNAVFNSYVKVHPINNPTQMQLKVNLNNIGNGRYAGDMSITYQDYGQWFNGTFETGTGINQVSYKNRYVGLPEAEFNQWFTYEGKRVFHAFFQDSIGAVILVVDGGIDLSDGGGIVDMTGSVYFKNFALSGAYDPPPSPEKCWFLYIGPYDCRAFKGGDGFVSTTSALYPSSADGWQRLGTFSGLNRVKAFNE